MLLSCCAIGCTNRHFPGTEKHFFHIPTNEDQRIKWIAAINRKNWTPTEGTRLCSDHFTSGKHYYKCNSRGFSYVGWFSKDPRHPDYVPSVFSFSLPTDSSSKLARLARAQKRNKNDNMPVKKHKELIMAQLILSASWTEPLSGLPVMMK